jgi:hypothetical protein
MVKEFFPMQNVGLLYCSGEANSHVSGGPPEAC